MQTYYTFASFLGADAEKFLSQPRLEQIALFKAYLAYLESEKVHFPTSKRATKCHATIRSDNSHLPLLTKLTEGQTISGFGVCGSPEGYLAQQELSIGAAYLATKVDHQYVVENPNVLNSRSFMFGWCHAEKQKIVDIHQKLHDLSAPATKIHWEHIILFVDRAMCADCIGFASAYAAYHGVDLSIQDPQCVRKFLSTGDIEVINNSDDKL
ncbi:hypothetical protein THRCLA_04743 [Thraustotheca clavata]|uniref:Single-strand DNA deaminase toxin A-like C-terminal domain-containing protein n=1 Tax=Thraustotheca clavata TaxID=74557 RepID=A0A1V9ZY49_9STRA|nr:hypothetical protein THRCLA_04743 [Thraustotheca clavata]